jgi:hypothetical protein
MFGRVFPEELCHHRCGPCKRPAECRGPGPLRSMRSSDATRGTACNCNLPPAYFLSIKDSDWTLERTLIVSLWDHCLDSSAISEGRAASSEDQKSSYLLPWHGGVKTC